MRFFDFFFFDFFTPKTFRNRSKTFWDGFRVFFPTFFTFSENFIFWPFWPGWAHKMSQLGPKWPKMVIFGPFLAILGVQKVGYPPKSNRMRSRNSRGTSPENMTRNFQVKELVPLFCCEKVV